MINLILLDLFKKNVLMGEMLMKKIRDLQVKKYGGISIHAEYLIDENNDIWYKEDGKIAIKGYQGPNWTCTDCKNWIFNAKTVNNVYQCRPLPPHTSKCKLINEKYPEFDITFKSNCTTHLGHSPCRHFIPRYNYEDWNINQFIDIKNCCKFTYGSIQGISKNGRQAPFSFCVHAEHWYNLDFIHNDKVIVYDPIFWDVYNLNGKERHTKSDYINDFSLDKKYHKEFNNYIRMDCIESKTEVYGRFFDFSKMWFD